MPTALITQFQEADYSLLFDNEMRESLLVSGDANSAIIQRPGSNIHIVVSGFGATYDNTPTYDDGEHLTSGTITQLEFYDGTTLIMRVSGLSLSAVDFDNGLYQWQVNGDPAPLEAVIGIYAINYDGTNLPSGAEGGGHGSDFGDTFTFGAGDYYVTLGEGADVIDAGTTSTFAQLSYANSDSPNGIVANWQTGTILDPYGSTDTFTGRVDLIRGTNAADQFIGDAQNNQIRGLGGNDTIDGGDGVDEIRYDRDAVYGGTAGVTVNLTTGSAIDGFGDTDTITNVENVRGSDSNDTLIGDGEANWLRGLGGDDILQGMGGNDLLDGGAGNDEIDGGAGNDEIHLGDGEWGDVIGSTGNDIIYVEGTTDSLFDYKNLTSAINFQIDDSSATVNKGVDGTDSVTGLSGIDYQNGGYAFRGGTADDSFIINGASGQYGKVSGRQGDDSYINIGSSVVRVDYRGEGSDSQTGITYSSNNGSRVSGTVTGAGIGTDTLSNINQIRGTNYDDVFNGGDGDEVLLGVDGDDTISGKGGNDVIDGGDGNDVIDGGAGNDELRLGDGEWGDVIGSTGDDIIYVNGTVDSVFNYENLTSSINFQINATTATINKGVNGIDTVADLGGIDFVNGGYQFQGGSGDDTFVVNGSSDQFGKVSGGQGDDSFTNIGQGFLRADYRKDGDTSHAGIIYTGNGGGKVSGTVTGTGIGTDTLTNIDEIRGTDYDDIFNGGSSDEIFILRGGNDTVDGGGGFDVVRFNRTGMGPVNVDLVTGAATGTFNGAAFSHTLTDIDAVIGSEDFTDRIFGSDNADTLLGRGGNDVLVGRDGNDELYGGDGDDLLNGNEGNDYIEGGSGNDTLNGGDGNDYLFGDIGNDQINLGRGEDNFVQGSIGFDTINIQGSLNSTFNYSWLNMGANFQIGDSTATVNKGVGGIDTVNGLDGIDYVDGGYRFEGTNLADVFTVNGGADQFGVIKSFGGDDTITNMGAGIVRVDYHGGFEDGIVPLFSAITYTSNNGSKVSGTVTGTFTGTDTLTNIDEISGTDLDDTFNGGDGDERFILRGGNDVVDGGGGIDMVRFDRSGIGAIDVDLEAGTATGTQSGVGFSHSLSNIEVIRGSRSDNDRIFGSDADETFFGRGGNDVLNGRAGNDDLNGEDGNDILNGGEGADRMAGGAGNDVYYVDNVGDTLVEDADGGFDQIFSFISLALRDQSQNIENLSLLGTDDTSGVGNDLSNTITGNSGNNVLNGSAGNDILIGGAGNDIFLDDSGADRMVGGVGNDVYYVDNVGDRVEEVANAGTDMVFSYISFALRDHSQYIENLQLLGTGNISGTGNGQSNLINGNSGNNILNGAFGDDVLFGGLGDDIFKDDTGADRMVGGGGNDTYYVDNVGDRVEENDGGGIDLVNSYIDFSLRDHSQYIENLNLLGTGNMSGTGNGLANSITGNSGNNLLNGGGGDDILRGGAGNDTFLDNAGADQMIGGVGDDTYYVDNVGDRIEEYANAGTDQVFAYTSFALRDHSQYLENLTLLGNQNISGTGNGLSNTIIGNGANNILNGAFGNDVLIGGAGDDAFLDDSGNDRFTGGIGNDVFIFRNAGEHDIITDFENGIDVIRIGGLGVTSFADITHSQQGSDVLLSFGGAEVTLENFDNSLISSDDFQFV